MKLVALNVEDLEFLPHATGRALVRRSKTDQAGEGSSTYLSRTTVRYPKAWLAAAEIAEGPVFRRVFGRGTAQHLPARKGQIGERLSVDGGRASVQAGGQMDRLPEEEVATVSGHSIRVGATQDLLTLNIDLASVMRALQKQQNADAVWEHVLAARGGMARAAQAQGRDSG